MLTTLGTQIEACNIDSVLRAVKLTHETTRKASAARTIFTIKIGERLDKDQMLKDKIKSIKKKMD